MKTRKRNGGATSTWHPRLRTRQAERSLLARRLTQLQSCAVASALTLAGIAAAPVALADSADNVRVAVVAARGATCGPPLQANPVVDRAAEAINQTTDNWINNVGRSVPETDALPILNDLGYAGNKARILSAPLREMAMRSRHFFSRAGPIFRIAPMSISVLAPSTTPRRT